MIHSIFQKTNQHPLGKRNLIEFIHIDFLLSFSSQKTDLSQYGSANQLVNFTQLCEFCLTTGMQYPIITCII